MSINKWSKSDRLRLKELVQKTTDIDILISELSSHSKEDIIAKIKYLKYYKPQPRGITRKYTINPHYFDIIDTEEKAYWYGFIFADGCITKTKSHANIILNLQIQDKDHLEQLKKAINSDVPIRERLTIEAIIRGKVIKPHPFCSLQICCTSLVDQLISKGCIPNKSFQKVFPTWLNESLYSHYIRGYFDGNGSIGYTRLEKQDYVRYFFQIISTEKHLNRIKEILDNQCQIETKINLHDLNPNNPIRRLEISGKNNVIRVGKYLYENATIFLNRKKIKFDEINNLSIEHSFWNPIEITQLTKIIQTTEKLNYSQLAQQFGRSENAIKEKAKLLKRKLLKL